MAPVAAAQSPLRSEPVLAIADAWPEAGLGHIARSSAVAAGLRARGLSCACVAWGAEQRPHSLLEWRPLRDLDALAGAGPELVLVDSYHLDPDEVRDRVGARRLAVMHDLGPVPPGADLVITTDPRLAGTQPRVHGGPGLACLGPLFWGLPDPAPAPERVRRVLVATGGADAGGHAVPVSAAVAAALPEAAVEVVRGPSAAFKAPAGVRLLDRPPSLLPALAAADLVVTAAGSTLLEALAVGVPALALLVADNQRPIAGELARRGGAELLEPAPAAAVGAAAGRLAGDPSARAELVRRGRALVDGYGALRAARLLWELVSR